MTDPATIAKGHMDIWMAEWRAAPWWRPDLRMLAWARAVTAARIMGDIQREQWRDDADRLRNTGGKDG